MISKPIQVRTFSSDIQVDKTLIARRAEAHSKECQLRRFLLYAHLINVLSSAAVNHIIQTPVPAHLNELRTVDTFLNVSPISTLDPPTPMSRNAQQDPASEPIDIEVPLRLPPLMCTDIIYSSSILVVLNRRNHMVDLDPTTPSCAVHWARQQLLEKW